MGWPPPSARLGTLAAAALLLHLLFVVSLPTKWLHPLFVEAVEGHGQASDFFGIYQAGENLANGFSIYDSDDYRNEAPRVVPFFYFYRYLPPTAYGAALAAVILPPWPAYWIWVALNEILMGLLVLSVLRDGRWPAARRWIIASVWLAFTPFHIEQIMGQFSLTMAAFLWVLWRCEREDDQERGLPRRRFDPVLAAWVASLSLKSFSAPMALPYLRDGKRRRVLFGGLLTVLLSLPYFVWRPGDIWEFLRLNLSPFGPRILKGSLGFQTLLRDLLSRTGIGSPEATLEILGRSVSWSRLAMAAAALGILLLALRGTWMNRSCRDASRRRAVDLLIWTGAFFLMFKSVWEYHYVMMLPAATAAYLTSGSRTVLAAAVLLALPTLYAAAPVLAGVPSSADLSLWPGWLRGLHFSTKPLPALALFLWGCREAGRLPTGGLGRPRPPRG